MKFRLTELKAQKTRHLDTRITWPDIETATGVPRNTLIALDQGNAKQVRLVYLDALLKYFNVEVSELVEAEDIILPVADVRSKV